MPRRVEKHFLAFHNFDCFTRSDYGIKGGREAASCGIIATETANAMVRYAFGALGMQRVGLTQSLGNEPSRRIAERLGFALEGIQRRANLLPGGKTVDRYCYARLDVTGLPELKATWGGG